MSPPNPPTVLIIGGTGAQGIPVVKALVHDGAYKVRLLTRDPSSPRARQLQALRPDLVDLVEGTFASAAFVNIDGFNAGEKTEMFWAVRAYELAIEEGVQFFVYANLDFVVRACC
jgi:nucleoside-diphosphate-sugar epimerase